METKFNCLIEFFFKLRKPIRSEGVMGPKKSPWQRFGPYSLM